MNEEQEYAASDEVYVPTVPEIISPISGEIVDPNDIDQLADALEMLNLHSNRLKIYREQVVRSIGKLAPISEDSKTSYVRGNSCRLKVVQPEDAWTQPILKDLWKRFPSLAAEYLRIGEVKVNLRNYDQIKREKGTLEFEEFRGELIAANRGKIGLPHIEIVRNDGSSIQESE